MIIMMLNSTVCYRNIPSIMQVHLAMKIEISKYLGVTLLDVQITSCIQFISEPSLKNEELSTIRFNSSISSTFH